MKDPAPARDAGPGPEEQIVKFSTSINSFSRRPPQAPLIECPPWRSIGNVVSDMFGDGDPATSDLIELRRVWWTLNRHHGENLPPENNVIVIVGGRR